jgi:hypothetical protein
VPRFALAVLAAAVVAGLVPAPAPGSASGVVVSEFRFRGPTGASDEFVELVNAAAAAVDVSGWRLQACSATTGTASTRATIPAGTVLAPGQHLLFAHSGYAGAPAPDVTYAIGIADGGGVRLVTSDAAYVDGVASSAAPTSECREGTGLSLPITDSETSFERVGGTQDTDANATDFAETVSDPQNLASVLPTLSVADVVVGEGGEALFTIALSAPSVRAVTVRASTLDRTGLAPGDYVATSAEVTLPPGTSSATFAVPIVFDALDEPDEAFAIALSAPTRATIADAVAEATIVDDDAEPSLSIAGARVAEGGEAQLRVTLSAPSAFTVSVEYATRDGTATAAADYTSAAGTIVLPPGTTTATIAVPTAADAVDEADESFTVTLSNPLRATLAAAGAEATIVDDDEPAEEPRASTPGTLLVFGRLGPRGVLLAWVGYDTGDAAPSGFVWYAEPGLRFASTAVTSLIVECQTPVSRRDPAARARDDDEDEDEDEDDDRRRANRCASVTGTAAIGGESQPFELRVDGRTVNLSWPGRSVTGRLRGLVRVRAH